MTVVNKTGTRVPWLLVLATFILLGVCACKTDSGKTPTTSRFPRIELKLTSDRPFPDSSETITSPWGETLYVSRAAVITDRHIASATLSRLEHGRLAILFNVSPAGQQSLQDKADQYVGRQLAVYLNGELIELPMVNSPLHQKFAISRSPKGFTDEEADRIIQAINRRTHPK